MNQARRVGAGLKKILGSQDFPILALLVVSLVIGILTIRDYGESWDELQFFKYADHALQSYSTWPQTGSVPLTGNTYDNYGPAYVMFVALGARFLSLLLPFTISDLRHLLYFITFLVSIWALYEICKRWLEARAAFGASLLYAAQPLFWGHAFISPKDIPFLTFFLLSLLFGFRMVDSVKPVSMESLTPRAKRSLIVITALWLLALFGLFAATNGVHVWLDGLVHAAAEGSSSLLPSIIAGAASGIHRVNPEIYIQILFVLFLRLRDLFFLVSTFLLVWLWRKVPGALRLVLSILPAALMLGIATSIRVLGPFAGILVIGYALWKSGRKVFPVLAIYAVLTLVVMYLTWPYLWPDPVGHLMESARVMAEYPWTGQVLFNGTFYASTAIPRSYLPVLLGIQLTEPVWFLFAIGLGVLVYDSIKKQRESRVLLILTVVWLILPLAGFVISRSALYDNFRQVFFILPPVFILAGVALEKIRRPFLQALLIGVLVLPGIVDGARIHPYEYIYYNRFIGGVQGAFRKYELDYWGTSYREAAMWLNEHAAQNAPVWVEGPTHILQLYVRRDLKIYSTYEAARADHYDYIVATSRYNLDLTSYPAAKVIYTIMRDGAVLTVIKQP
jgi:Dolichyl-phosphate-mannose-protein mannosyltransferase